MSITKDFEKRNMVEVFERYTREETEKLLAHTRALEAMLKKHERVKVSIDKEDVCWDYCPECREYFPNGMGMHKPDCELANLLEGVE